MTVQRRKTKSPQLHRVNAGFSTLVSNANMSE